MRTAFSGSSGPSRQPHMLEQYVQDQVQRLLGRDGPPNPSERLGALGLDLRALAKLKQRIERDLGPDIPFAQLLWGPSILELAAWLSRNLTRDDGRESRFHGDRTDCGEWPLSGGQSALWFLHQLHPDSPAYNIATAVRIHSHLDKSALRRAFQQVVDRHAALRTTFVTRDGLPVQRIAQHEQVFFVYEDAAAWQQTEVDAFLAREANRSFDLERGPLLRVHLLSRAEEDHVLLLNVHHIAADFGSLALLLRELGVLYPAERDGVPGSLPSVRLRYHDYATWQGQFLLSQRANALAEYWRRVTAGEVQASLIPSASGHPQVGSFRGDSVPFKVGPALTRSLRALAMAESTTMNTLLLSAFFVFISRHTGDEDVIIGSPMIGHSRSIFPQTVGYFVNTLPLRTSVRENLPFSALLTTVRHLVRAAIRNHDYPLANLTELLQGERHQGLAQPFRTTFLLENARMAKDRPLAPFALGEAGAETILGGLQIESLSILARPTQFDLSLLLADTEDMLWGSFRYGTDVYDKPTVERLARRYLTLLEGCVASPDTPLATLPLLPDDEARLVRDVFPHGRLPETLPQPNITAAAHIVPEGALLHELFLAQVARTPEAVALIWPGDEVPSTTDATSSDPPATLTYRDLQASAQRLAHALSANGVRQGDLVGLCTPRSPSMVAGVLGILLAGAAYVPLDPSYPSARLAYLLDDARPRVLLAHRAAASQLPPLPSGTSLLWLDDLLASSPLGTLSPLEDSPPFALPSDPERDQRIAYVIYTSGSTGLPKGVAISHRSVVHLACSLDAAVYRPAGLALLMPADEDGPDGMPPWRALRASLNAPLAFDASVQQLLLILGGHALVLVPESARRDPAALVELVRSEHLDVLDCTPSHLQALLSAGLLDIDRTAPRPPPALLLIGGEDLHKALWTTLAEAAEGADRTLSMNVYGPTECTVDATVGLVTAELPSIGRPLPGVEAYVLDRQLRPCPIGVPGELYIGGPGLARGYLRRPALTAERFVPHPFSTLPGARLYKTGDRARWLPDGNLEYLGRLDHQVKIRGHRVELGEVEATLRRLQGVGDAAVIAIAGPGSAPEDASPSSDLRLVAYVAPSHPGPVSSDETLTPDSLRSGLAHNMPAYLLPAAIIILDSLPLTPNGKLDRNALPPPDWSLLAASSAGEGDAPRTPMEEVVAGIWARILGLDAGTFVGRHADFFALGGHSLLATQAVARLRAALGAAGENLPLRWLFDHPTPAALAPHMEALLQQRAVGQSNEAPVIPPLAAVVRPPGAPLQVPVSYAQERLWVVEQLIPDTAAYHLPAALRLRGALDIDALREALGALVARHESLRTAFVALDGQPMQLVAPPPDPAALAQAWPLPLVDLSGDEANVDARLTTLAQEVATTPFPLDRAPLVRAVLAHLGPQEHVLVLVAHHLIIDGWSIGLLVRDLAALYTAAHGGLRGEVLLASLPVLPLQYADFSVWQRNTPGPLDGPALDRLLAYWRTALGAPTLRDDADSEGRSGRTEWQLPPPRPARRPPPALSSKRTRRHRACAGTRIAGASSPRPRPRRGRDSLYGAPRVLPTPLAPPHCPAGDLRRYTRRRTHPPRDGGHRRLLRQHPCPPRLLLQ